MSSKGLEPDNDEHDEEHEEDCKSSVNVERHASGERQADCSRPGPDRKKYQARHHRDEHCGGASKRSRSDEERPVHEGIIRSDG